MSTQTTAPYPVHVDADLDPGLSRGLWLVKWLLAIPHYLVLAVLWIGFAVTTVVAFFAILVTGRYPRAIFDFNVGVMRWNWRVAFYAYGALGTDRYPPFTLGDVPDYPAHLEVDYPDHLSRGLVLVKWWLLAIPHYLVIGLFVGGLGYGVSGADDDPLLSVSLIGILVLIAGVALLVTGTYPRRVFDLLLGLNRWVLRVAGYVGLMTDRYPPFSLDQGGHDPSPEVALARPVAPASPTAPTAPGTTLPAPRRPGWTAGRVVSLVTGSVVVLISLGFAAGGLALVVADQTQRDDDGFLMSPGTTLASDGFAIVSEDVQVHTDGASDWLPSDVVGDVRITAESTSGSELFLGVAPADEAAAYLSGVQYSRLLELRDGKAVYDTFPGQAPTTAPSDETFWTAEASGSDPVLTLPVEDGDWTVVVMAADGSQPVAAEVSAGAEVPILDTLIAILLVLAALGLLVGGLLIGLAVRSASGPDPDSRP